MWLNLRLEKTTITLGMRGGRRRISGEAKAKLRTLKGPNKRTPEGSWDLRTEARVLPGSLVLCRQTHLSQPQGYDCAPSEQSTAQRGWWCGGPEDSGMQASLRLRASGSRVVSHVLRCWSSWPLVPSSQQSLQSEVTFIKAPYKTQSALETSVIIHSNLLPPIPSSDWQFFVHGFLFHFSFPFKKCMQLCFI